jgi:hypothetical protein
MVGGPTQRMAPPWMPFDFVRPSGFTVYGPRRDTLTSGFAMGPITE